MSSTNELSSRAMLADFSTSVWDGRKKNKAVADEITSSKHAEKDAGAWWTRVLPRRTVKPIWAAVNNGRRIHATFTLPWSNDGARILPAEMFMKYTEQMRRAEERFEDAVQDFVREYPDILAGARKRLGDLFDKDAYPSPAEVRGKFKWEVEIMPIPSSNDFRVELGDRQVASIRKGIEAQVNERMKAATSDLWERLHKVVAKAAESLGEPDKVFKDSLIGNVKEICQILPALNVTGDTKLEKIRGEVEKTLAKAKPSEMRQNAKERKATADAAKKIADTMAGIMG